MVLQWRLSCILRKHLTNLQKLHLLGASGNMCQSEWHWMISDHSKSSSHIYKSSSMGHSEQDDKKMITHTSDHKLLPLENRWFSSTHARHRARAHFPPCGSAPYNAVIVLTCWHTTLWPFSRSRYCTFSTVLRTLQPSWAGAQDVKRTGLLQFPWALACDDTDGAVSLFQLTQV